MEQVTDFQIREELTQRRNIVIRKRKIISLLGDGQAGED